VAWPLRFCKTLQRQAGISSSATGKTTRPRGGQTISLGSVQTVAEGSSYRQQILGSASIQRGLPLQRYKTPDSGLFTPAPIFDKYLDLLEQVDDPRLTHSIGVIIDPRLKIKAGRDILAYKQLVQKVETEDPEAHAWLLIPNGERGRHERYLVTQAGLGRIALAPENTQRYYDLESRNHAPPMNEIYGSRPETFAA
jgi:hypothetical protein